MRLDPLPISYQRNGSNRATTVDPVWSCAYTPKLARDDAINAWADGQSLFITTGIMRFAQDDDELAAVIGHELAHNAMRHIDAAKKNTVMGGLLGAAADIAAAGLGVNTQGAFTKEAWKQGSQVFSQDFEREADYVGLYMLALERTVDRERC